MHELLGRAVARGRRVVARGLVAPGAIEGVFHDGHDLDMGIAHVAHVVDELDREVVIRVVGAALGREGVAGAGVVAVLVRLALRLVAMAFPAAQMNLVNVKRALHVVVRAALFEPGVVAPLVPLEVHEARCGARNIFGVETIRVGLVEHAPVVRLDHELVEVAFYESAHEALPDAARVKRGERVRRGVPIVEVTHHMDGFHVGRPDGEMPAVHTLLDIGVGAELLPAALPGAGGKHIPIVFGDDEARFLTSRSCSAGGRRLRGRFALLHAHFQSSGRRTAIDRVVAGSGVPQHND